MRRNAENAKPPRIAASVTRPPGPVDLHAVDNPVRVALEAAEQCEWLEHAFHYGYQAALRQRFAGLPAGVLAMCHSESGGSAPRQLQFRARPSGGGWLLNGRKGFITAPQWCTQMLVSAVCGEDAEGQRDIGVFIVQMDTPLVQVEVYEEVRVMPRLGQGGIVVDELFVERSARIQGDYDSLIRPFGVAETITCAAACASAVVGRARDWGADALGDQARLMRERLKELALTDSADPNTVLGCADLADEFDAFKRDTLAGVRAGSPEREADWTRDINLFGFSGPLWARRIARAHQDLNA